MQALILAAGKGTRMKSQHAKVMHEILGRPILDYVLETLKQIGVRKTHVVVGNNADQVCSFLKGKASVIYQRVQKGTAHAAQMAESALGKSNDDILIWPGDMPLLRSSTLKCFLKEHQARGLTASVLSSLQVDPYGYGRIVRLGGRLQAIREELDATETERRIQEVNTGVYLFKAKLLFQALRKIESQNKKKEFYLTDVIEVLKNKGHEVEAFGFAHTEEGLGINSRKDLAVAIKKINQREVQYHQDKGVTFIAPDQTFVAPGVKMGADTIVYPWCYIEKDVKIGKNCQIGPFAKLRKGTVIGDGSMVGSFVETARAKLGEKVLAKHLSYLGDTEIGDGTNIGAGTITANFDGKKKSRTKIGKNVQIGSNTVFVAPVEVGSGAKTGAGSVIKRRTKIKPRDVVGGVPAVSLKNKKR